MPVTLWKVTCEEHRYPGLWQRWVDDCATPFDTPNNRPLGTIFAMSSTVLTSLTAIF